MSDDVNEPQPVSKYCFRLRVRVTTKLPLSEELFALAIPEFPGLELKRQEDPGWAVFQCCTFETEEEAAAAGRRFADMLSIAGAVERLEVDVGLDRPTQHFFKAFQEAASQELGRTLMSEVHGLMTFQKDTVAIANFGMRGSVSTRPDKFEERISPWFQSPRTSTERQRNCAALLNNSFFVENVEGQFVLRVSAVEALCDQSDAGDEFLAVIERLDGYLTTLECSQDSRKSARRLLHRARHISIRQAYMRKFRSLVGDQEAKAFDRLYALRSAFLHDGHRRGELSEAASEALELGVKLLRADVKQEVASI